MFTPGIKFVWEGPTDPELFYGSFERRYVASLGRQHLPAGEAVRRTEAFWAAQSQREHRAQHAAGVLGLVAGGIRGTLAIVAATTAWPSSTTTASYFVSALLGVTAGMGIIGSVSALLQICHHKAHCARHHLPLWY